MKDGDRNTKYFHTSIRRNSNSISCLVAKGRTFTKMADIKSHIVRVYKALYSNQDPIPVDLSSLNVRVLLHDQRQQLESTMSEDEIKAAVWGCDPSKAPSYDGFNIKFIITVWNVIGKDVISFV